MKTTSIITLIFTIIFFAFFHVFLQTETIKLGYKVKQNEDISQELLEDNRVLHYNIYALESPYRLERYVTKRNSDLKHLEAIHVLSVYPEHETHYAKVKEKGRRFFFDNSLLLSLQKLFTGKSAEAKTIK